VAFFLVSGGGVGQCDADSVTICRILGLQHNKVAKVVKSSCQVIVLPHNISGGTVNGMNLKHCHGDCSRKKNYIFCIHF
jgi:hypothetical protein